MIQHKILNGLLFSVLIFTHVNTLKAQSLEWSNTQKLRGNSIYTTVIGEDESGIYVMRHRNKLLSKFIVLERYRHNLGFENSRSYLLKNTRILYCDLNETGLLIIKQVTDRKNHSFKIIATYLNGSFESILNETLLFQIKFTAFNSEPQFIIKPSSDHKKYFIFNFETDVLNNFICRYMLIDNKLSVNSKREFILKPDLKIESISDLIIDNNFEYTLLAIPKAIKTDRHYFMIIEQSGDTNQIKYVSDATYSLEQLLLYYNYADNIKGVTGFYTSAHENGFEGNFTIQWKNIESMDYHLIRQPFSGSILKELAGDLKEQSGFLPHSYQSQKIFCRTDGGYIKISENIYTRKDQDLMIINGIPTSQGKNIYTFENILIQNFDSSGTLSWENWVSKNQNSVNDGGMLSSVFISATPYSVNIIYNDPIATGGDIVLASFLSSGQKEIKVIAKGDEMNAFIIPAEGRQISSHKIVVPVLKDRKFALLKITFK